MEQRLPGLDDPWLLPDYDRSIVNLVTSIAQREAPAAELYPGLVELEQSRVHERPVALLVIDGLGYQFLQRFPDSYLARHCASRLTSCFPTTTATAVTALALGVPAQQHGIPGWYTHMRELGGVVMPLPFIPRGGGSCYSRKGVQAQQMLDVSALLPQLSRPVRVCSPAYISDSDFSRALYGRSRRGPFQGLEQFFERLSQGLEQRGNPLVWGYWTELDAMAHELGVDSPELEEHFWQIDQKFGQWLEWLAGSDTLVLVTADHGLIDCRDDQRLLLDQHPEIDGMLRLPLCGEPRVAFCYLRPGAEAEFVDAIEQQAPGLFGAVESEALLEAGLFGRGQPSLRLRERIGDLTLLARDQAIIKDRLLQEDAFNQRGVHGGLSAQELYVPLIVAEP
ncbi:phosphodiesterase [Motiliproteus coralliicola]|uniref:Phosphodiesterase n=1 Tax=Motiliproteus coralliicola TaxID=2283196 RepID=A0A369WF03_9GAMM|nr:alkaline phosphatase family protein [Motiliproteus coralliicola]RDE19931.1 phosphodiesterase [Motiliproteus coralliicola]